MSNDSSDELAGCLIGLFVGLFIKLLILPFQLLFRLGAKGGCLFIALFIVIGLVVAFPSLNINLEELLNSFPIGFGKTTYVIGSTPAKARECPRLDCKQVTTFQPGEEIQVIGIVSGQPISDNGDWLRVLHNNSVVYVHSSLASPIEPTVTPPVQPPVETVRFYISSDSRANGRSCPKLNCQIAGKFAPGEQIDVISVDQGDQFANSNKWLHIRPKNTDIYIHSSLAKFLPVFKEADCTSDPFNSIKIGEDQLLKQLSYHCGHVKVPEDRANLDNRYINLGLVRFLARDHRQDDPIIYLQGGPGISALASLPKAFIQSFVNDRDIIVFDQRGNLYSEPADCPVDAARRGRLEQENLNFEDSKALSEDYLKQCLMDLTATQKRNPSAYTSAASAADVNDIRIALGYKTKINLYGVSYGTRLGLTVMRDFGSTIRSAILDSVLTPEESIVNQPITFDRSMELLYSLCKDDTRCNSMYPKLEEEFKELLAILEQDPIPIKVAGFPTRDGGQPIPVLLDGDRMIGIIFQALYSRESIERIPYVIYATRRGEITNELTEMIRNNLYTSEGINLGVYYSVFCNEEYAFETESKLDDIYRQYPEYKNAFGPEQAAALAVCDEWRSGKSVNPIESRPVSSAIPTLLLSGELDPITPPTAGTQTREKLTRSFAFTLPGLGHGVIGDPCASEIAVAFMSKPQETPDSTCLAKKSFNPLPLPQPVPVPSPNR